MSELPAPFFPIYSLLKLKDIEVILRNTSVQTCRAEAYLIYDNKDQNLKNNASEWEEHKLCNLLLWCMNNFSGL